PGRAPRRRRQAVSSSKNPLRSSTAPLESQAREQQPPSRIRRQAAPNVNRRHGGDRRRVDPERGCLSKNMRGRAEAAGRSQVRAAGRYGTPSPLYPAVILGAGPRMTAGPGARLRSTSPKPPPPGGCATTLPMKGREKDVGVGLSLRGRPFFLPV